MLTAESAAAAVAVAAGTVTAIGMVATATAAWGMAFDGTAATCAAAVGTAATCTSAAGLDPAAFTVHSNPARVAAGTSASCTTGTAGAVGTGAVGTAAAGDAAAGDAAAAPAAAWVAILFSFLTSCLLLSFSLLLWFGGSFLRCLRVVGAAGTGPAAAAGLPLQVKLYSSSPHLVSSPV